MLEKNENPGRLWGWSKGCLKECEGMQWGYVTLRILLGVRITQVHTLVSTYPMVQVCLLWDMNFTLEEINRKKCTKLEL